MGEWFVVAFFGFLGAASRYGITLGIPDGGGSSFPWATMGINLVGSLLLGTLFGWCAIKRIAPWWREALGTGFLGAFTTFSAFNAQLWELWRNEAYAAAVVYLLVSSLGGALLASAGLHAGRRWGS
ncbi:CrcB family protein [Cohnella sp. AR92]|uniref:fluoride efflux transporter FluC n=1 Tax=Cohnella sp. AR92 TaxID=648716 RepID=UPI000F8C80EB|nr:CrcB family protein [Cohnella sp. AR92]RUS48356.1 CrcB family protein [Cohnella sp. AR92]